MNFSTARTLVDAAYVFNGTVFATAALMWLFPEPFKPRPVRGSSRWLRHRSTRIRGGAMALASVLLFCGVMLPLTWQILIGGFLAAVAGWMTVHS